MDEAEAILTDEQADLNEFGRLLDHTWKLKRGTGAAVSTECIDALYARGIAAGALGGKLLGAGGGGFLVFYVEPEHQAAVRQAMQQYISAAATHMEGGVATAIDFAVCAWVLPHIACHGLKGEGVRALIGGLARAMAWMEM